MKIISLILFAMTCFSLFSQETAPLKVPLQQGYVVSSTGITYQGYIHPILTGSTKIQLASSPDGNPSAFELNEIDSIVYGDKTYITSLRGKDGIWEQRSDGKISLYRYIKPKNRHGRSFKWKNKFKRKVLLSYFGNKPIWYLMKEDKIKRCRNLNQLNVNCFRFTHDNPRTEKIFYRSPMFLEEKIEGIIAIYNKTGT